MEPFDPFGEPVPLPLNGELDLHGFQPRDVRELLPEWLIASRQAGFVDVLIIHGKGTGALRETVRALLDRSPLVAAQGPGRDWGSTAARLHPRSSDAARLTAILAQASPVVAVLQLVARLGPPGAWVGAGLVRNALWQRLLALPGDPPLTDIDVIWHDPADAPPQAEVQATLAAARPELDWEAVNQALLPSPAADLAGALARWPETATAVAARWRGGVELLAPLGLDDLAAAVIRRNPACPAEAYRRRLASKGWKRRFPGVTVLSD